MRTGVHYDALENYYTLNIAYNFPFGNIFDSKFSPILLQQAPPLHDFLNTC